MTAIRHPPRSTSPPLRRLPNLGPDRKGNTILPVSPALATATLSTKPEQSNQ
jgi:hypothetical protein